MSIHVAIVEDNRSFRAKLVEYLNETPGYKCVGDCDSAEDALKLIPRWQPEVVLMDIHLPN
ncbi:MAG TPA: response regulator, partial [Verrucomicrobiae bacterium]